MRIDERLLNSIREHSNNEGENECCGFVLLKDGKHIIHKAKNSVDPEFSKTNFAICGRDYLNAIKLGKIYAIYHSHNYDYISENDKKFSRNSNIPYLIFHKKSNKFSIYDPKDDVLTYIEGEFKIGINDCYTIVKEHYEKKLGILLENYSRDEGWYDKNPKIMIESARKEGLEVLENIKSTNELKVNDILATDNKHLCIYLGNGQIIHRRRGRSTEVEPLTNARLRRLTFVARKKDDTNR